MNYDIACEILGMEKDKDYSMIELKKIYRQKALAYHPDKNLHMDTTAIFQDIQDSYEYLLIEFEYKDSDSESEDAREDLFSFKDSISSKLNSYSNILYSFLKPIIQSETFKEIQSKLVYVIIEKLMQKCENQAFGILEKIDKKAFIKIYELLKKYKAALHITDEFLSRLEEHFTKKVEKDECIILNPFLEDLFENNVYKLVINSEKFLIPLWHHELVYDICGSDLYVRCNPILPDNITIDENNNIHVIIKKSIDEIWNADFLEINLSKKNMFVPKNQIKFMEHQVILFANMGISKINTKDIYDVTRKTDIYLHLDLYKD